MKKDIILLLLFILPIISKGDPFITGFYCQQAKNLIEDAKMNDKTDLLNTLTLLNYQTAWDLCPDAFSCWDITTLGHSYYLNNNYLLAIKFLSKAEKCETGKMRKEGIYNSLSQSYFKIKNYELAINYGKKSLKLLINEEDISFCYSHLASIYQEQNNHKEAIKNLRKQAKHYLKFLRKTNRDVMRGNVRNIGFVDPFIKLSDEYKKINKQGKSEKYLIKSALCGNSGAIEQCKKLGLRYKVNVN